MSETQTLPRSLKYSLPVTDGSGQAATPRPGQVPLPDGAANLDSPMAGFDPARPTLPRPQPQAPAQPGYEFDPQKEITPLGGRFFDKVENDPRLSRSAKTRIQSGYLDGIDDVQAQRQKLESERMRSMLGRQRLETGNMAIAEMRRRQDEIARQTEVQKTAAGALRGIVGSNLPPDEQRKQIAAFKLENAASIYADPALRYTVDAAESMVPPPMAPLYSTKDMRGKLEAGVPPEVVLKGDPVEIGFYERIIAAQKMEQSEKLSERKSAAKEYRSTIMDLAKDPPSFMDEDEAFAAGVSPKDPNAARYLTPESQQKGRILVGLLSGQEGLAAFEQLSDAEKRDAIMVVQRDAMFQLVQKFTNVDETSEEDVRVDSLFNR